MKKQIWMICFIFFLSILTGCQSAGEVIATDQSGASSTIDPYIPPASDSYPLPESTPTRKPYVFKASELGTVTIHGELLAMDPNNLPDPNDAIFLVSIPDDQVTTIPSIVVGEVPQADVDERTFEFVFTNIEPGLYAVMVLTLGNAQIPTRTEDGSFVIIRVEETDRDQTVELGYIRIP
ncbi:MAG: hypothetical protein KKD28_00395 [Chloroflexi bacterium]|nr:hypothetical protein [Chloroflexota bacterium]MBU1659913.1 hypothetical protein [Chloroflexota bacterium]